MTRGRHRAAVSLIVTTALAGILAGCSPEQSKSAPPSQSPSVMPTATGSAAHPSHAVRAVSSGVAFDTAITTGELIYDGTVSLTNDSAASIRLVSVAPASDAGEAAEVVDTHVVTLGASDTGIGLVRKPVSDLLPHLVASPVTDAELAPGGRYALVLTLRGRQPGAWRPHQIHVTYQVAGARYTVDIQHNASICVDADKTDAC